MTAKDITTSGRVTARRIRRLTDDRGWFLKVLMRQHLKAADLRFGEIYLTAAHPGQVKGNHYHRHATEWFIVTRGRGRLVTEDMKTGDSREFLMAEDDPVVVRVPPDVAHAIQNVGDDLMILLAYADQPYDPDEPDEVRHTLLTAPS